MDVLRPNMTGISLLKLNAIRIIIVLMIALGYASTMPLGESNSAGEPNPEILAHLGYDPSWIGISLLFFLSGFLGMRSLERHGSAIKYLESRLIRNAPLLIFVTLIVVLILYPVFGNPSTSFPETFKTIIFYFLGTVTCLKPGEPLPGLLDHANYECLIQGAIWTLKWGVIAHIGLALAHQLNLFKNRVIVAIFAILAAIFYFLIFQLYLQKHNIPSDIILGAQLAWPFLTGVAIFKFWDKIPVNFGANLIISAGFFIAASIQFYVDFLPWSKAIVICLTMGWAWLCISFLKLRDDQFTFMNNWTSLALALYLVNWPTAQILLLSMPDLPISIFITLSLTITVFLSWVFHKLISERSFRYAQQRISGKKHLDGNIERPSLQPLV